MSLKTPIYDFLNNYKDQKAISFHMPGHKNGRGYRDKEGYYKVFEDAGNFDITEISGADNLHNPSGIIREAQDLASKLYNVKETFFLVNGTTSGIYAMILSVTQPGDKIIIPRNCHRSVINSLILGDLKPIYTYPRINEELGIATVVTLEEITRAIKEHPEAKAVVITYPNYYGMACNIEEIEAVVHRANMVLLVDGAHGSHFIFNNRLPICAIKAKADAVAHSTHKTISSFTQSSMLHINSNRIDIGKVNFFLQLTQSTSPSYLLMASLDASRALMEEQGRVLLDKAIDNAQAFRMKVSQLKGLFCLGDEVIGSHGVFDMDPTRLVINIRDTGLSGHQVENILREKFNINMEFSDLYNVIGISSLYNDKEDFDILYRGLEYIAKNNYNIPTKKEIMFQWSTSPMIYYPREAVYKKKVSIDLKDSIGKVSAEYIIPYPPGIPLVVPGEQVTAEVVDIINSLIKSEISIIGPIDQSIKTIQVITD